ncbi:MAG: peptidyl-alpha-hydroxyglycine alpha-amidating lyase family protein [Gemmatimonadota bacterium]
MVQTRPFVACAPRGQAAALARGDKLLRRTLSGAALLLIGVVGNAQTPTNDAPNPYRTVEGWAKLPAPRTWGSTSGVGIDRDGKSIWVAERCGVNSCIGSSVPSVLKFDETGKLVTSFGSGLIQAPHGLTVDRDGNVWVTDCSCTRPPAGVAMPDSTGPKAGHQIYKFSADGKLLMTLGAAGGGREPGFFWQPNAVLVAPNGDIFVAEGHSSAAGSTARLFKFKSDGTLIKSWGKLGSGPDDFNQPHALAMDSRGRLFIGDRGNDRIVITDQDGKRLDTWYQFSRPSGIFIDAKDNIYVADSESGSVNPAHKDWKRGIRIGSAKDGSITAFIPDPAVNPPSTSAAEGVAVDAKGNVYGAEVGPKALKRYEKP